MPRVMCVLSFCHLPFCASKLGEIWSDLSLVAQHTALPCRGCHLFDLPSLLSPSGSSPSPLALTFSDCSLKLSTPSSNTAPSPNPLPRQDVNWIWDFLRLRGKSPRQAFSVEPCRLLVVGHPCPQSNFSVPVSSQATLTEWGNNIPWRWCWNPALSVPTVQPRSWSSRKSSACFVVI